MSFKGLVSKLKAKGMSPGAAAGTAGKIAKLKEEGRGKGPTKAQKKTMTGKQKRQAAKVQRKLRKAERKKS
jgi:hypothetical protein